MPHPVVHSIQIGRIRPLREALGAAAPTDSKPIDSEPTGIVKTRVDGRIAALRLGLDGDEQANKVHHGGHDMAILTYSLAHYEMWRDLTGQPDVGPGWFGENITVDGLHETQVCIGDRWRVGGALLEVTKPRGPCATLARRWNRSTLPAEVLEHTAPGWYSAVIEEGEVGAGDTFELVARPYPDWTIARYVTVIYDRDAVREHLPEIERMTVLGERGLEYARARANG